MKEKALFVSLIMGVFSFVIGLFISIVFILFDKIKSFEFLYSNEISFGLSIILAGVLLYWAIFNKDDPIKEKKVVLIEKIGAEYMTLAFLIVMISDLLGLLVSIYAVSDSIIVALISLYATVIIIKGFIAIKA